MNFNKWRQRNDQDQILVNHKRRLWPLHIYCSQFQMCEYLIWNQSIRFISILEYQFWLYYNHQSPTLILRYFNHRSCRDCIGITKTLTSSMGASSIIIIRLSSIAAPCQWWFYRRWLIVCPVGEASVNCFFMRAPILRLIWFRYSDSWYPTRSAYSIRWALRPSLVWATQVSRQL